MQKEKTNEKANILHYMQEIHTKYCKCNYGRMDWLNKKQVCVSVFRWFLVYYSTLM